MTKEQVIAVLRRHWPESGGQSSHQEAVRAQEACAEEMVRALMEAESPK